MACFAASKVNSFLSSQGPQGAWPHPHSNEPPPQKTAMLILSLMNRFSRYNFVDDTYTILFSRHSGVSRRRVFTMYCRAMSPGYALLCEAPCSTEVCYLLLYTSLQLMCYALDLSSTIVRMLSPSRACHTQARSVFGVC